MKKNLALILCVAILFTLSDNAVAKKQIKLNYKKVTMNVGATYKINVKNAAAKTKVTWKSEKKKIAKVIKKNNKGKKAYAIIKAMRKGKTNITAICKNGSNKKVLKCKIIVKNSVSKNEFAQVDITDNKDDVITTNKPVSTMKPTQTSKPVQTNKPQTTDKPVQTQKPGNTNTDKNDLIFPILP